MRRFADATGWKALRSLATRFHADLAGAAVHSWNWRSLVWKARLRRKSGVRGPKSEVRGRFGGFIEVGHRFAVRVREALRRRSDLGPDSILFAYDTGALEALEWCRSRGIKCVLGQMDPNRVEVELVREEEKLWPGWQSQPLEVPEEYFRRREREWAFADRILVNSEFCRKALIQQGVRSEKLVVVPLCYEPDEEKQKTESAKRKAGQPLRILFLGQVILRKGIQYLIGAARRLERENIQFDVVGPIGISEEAVATAPANITFHGRCKRDHAANWYQQADVFALPTISDGFAITQIEAMSHGLPVVTTACCGEVVADGVDGFLVPPRDADALARALQRYLMEPALLRSQQAATVAKARQFTLQRLAENLLSLEQAIFQ